MHRKSIEAARKLKDDDFSNSSVKPIIDKNQDHRGGIGGCSDSKDSKRMLSENGVISDRSFTSIADENSTQYLSDSFRSAESSAFVALRDSGIHSSRASQTMRSLGLGRSSLGGSADGSRLSVNLDCHFMLN